MIAPIKPSDVHLRISDQIIQAINDLIQEKWTGSSAYIYHKEILGAISFKDVNDLHPSNDIIPDYYCSDIMDIYREVGWRVENNSPTYDEHWDSYFIFYKN